MSTPQPPQLAAAFDHLSAALEKVEQRKVDLLKEPWAAIEKGVVKLLGGPFSPSRQDHQLIALGLASALGARLHDEFKAFWFPFRDAPEGASLGFPDALVMLSPFGAVADALLAAKLDRVEDAVKDIRTSLGKVRFGGGTPMQLRADDYMRLFDPGFVQLVALDAQKADQVWNSPPERVASEVRDALGRAAKLPPELKKQLEQQLVTSLQRLEPGRPMIQQLERSPRLCETVGLLFAATASTGSAPEELWLEMVMPLLFVGAPQSFPPLGEEELAAAKQGVHPLFLFLDVVPFQFKAPEEDGLLGAFPASGLAMPHPGFKAAGQLRLVKVPLDAVKAPLAQFDPAKTRDAIARFGTFLREKTGPVQSQGEGEAKQMLDAALALLTDFKAVVQSGKDVCLRRLTEAEAASEPALSLVRQALQGPRIILAP